MTSQNTGSTLIPKHSESCFTDISFTVSNVQTISHTVSKFHIFCICINNTKRKEQKIIREYCFQQVVMKN